MSLIGYDSNGSPLSDTDLSWYTGAIYSTPYNAPGFSGATGPMSSAPIAATPSIGATGDFQQWISTLSGLAAGWYNAINKSTPPPVLQAAVPPGAGRVPTVVNTTPTQQLGIGTVGLIIIVALLVFLGLGRRRR